MPQCLNTALDMRRFVRPGRGPILERVDDSECLQSLGVLLDVHGQLARFDHCWVHGGELLECFDISAGCYDLSRSVTHPTITS